MSVITRRTVSIAPLSTSARNSSRVSGTRHSYTACRDGPQAAGDRDQRLRRAGRLRASGRTCAACSSRGLRARRGAPAGGVPVLIPPTGGLDRDRSTTSTGWSSRAAPTSTRPSTARSRIPESSGFYDHRDAAELELMRAALASAMPVLGICRGMQLLNVARGGDLIQHLEGDTHKGPPGMYTRHSVTVLAGTHLAGVLGTDAHTHSCHHQAPGRLGEGLRVAATGRGRDGGGDRGPGRPLRGRRAVASRGGRGGRRGALPRAGRPGDDVSEGGGMSVQAIEGLVIGGERVDAAEGRTFEVVNPATATTLASGRRGRRRGREPRRGGRIEGATRAGVRCRR